MITTLADKSFTTETIDGELFLAGQRGALYFLRQLGELGRFEVISATTGTNLRDKFSRPVIVTCIGDIIEAA